MKLFDLRWAALGGLALLVAAQGVRAEAPPDLALDYHVYAGGFHALTIRAEIGLQTDTYEVQVEARTDGLVDRIVRFSLEAQVTGRADSAGLSPAWFRSANRWRRSGGERSVEISYAADGRPEARIDPPAEEDNRDPVPADLLQGTLDPISAILGLALRLAESGRCESRAAVFDGRRRYDVVAEHLGEVEVKASRVAPFAGSTVSCGLSFEQVGGFWKDRRRDGGGPPVVKLYFAPVVAGAPPVPVRLHAKNRLGALRIHLVEARSLGVDGTCLAEACPSALGRAVP